MRTVNYYDNYSFPSARAYTNQLGVTTTALVKGQQTGSRTRMLNAGAQWLVSTTYYDTEYRPVQLIRDLFDLGTITTERVSTKYKYDLAPIVDVEWTEHLNSPTATIATNRVVKTFTYDHADRLLSVKENISVGSVSKEVTTLAQRYNVLGHLQSKWFQSANGQEFRRKTNYTNNIRGWQTDAKTVYKQTTATELPFYTIKLSYVNGSNYTNGNISKMEWGGKDDAAFTAGLSYTYDGINRLKSAVKPAGASYTYNESETGINYFRNGNIQNLVRAGAAVDNLTYTYAGNRLSSISDASGNNTGVKNGSSSFTYDNNGNMLNDGNRGAILTYNMLNLPNTVTIASKIFTYDYDAAGSKHKYAGDTVNVKYAGIFEYDANNVVKRISTSEGQALFRSGAISFNYYVKDHLGNARVVFNEAGAILQKTDYYPFGLEIDRNQPAVSQAARNNANRYNFLGKETQVITGYIDLQARFYDPAVGRFLAVDPVTEGQDAFSPYHYSFNNPIRFSDPDGRWPGEGLWKSFKKWYNTPLTKGQQEISRAASISGAPSKTEGEVLKNSLTLGLSHAVAGWQPDSFRRPANMYKQGASGPNTSGKTSSSIPETAPAPSNVVQGEGTFIVSERGTAASTSQERMKSAFENAGLPSQPTESAGTQYTLPNGSTVRTMEPSGQAPKRASFENKNGQPVDMDGRTVNPPQGLTPQERKEYIRDRTHIKQE